MEKIYCFTLDDNIRFMENACRRKEPSLLQSPYLAMLFRQHKEFGCKFQLNTAIIPEVFHWLMFPIFIKRN